MRITAAVFLVLVAAFAAPAFGQSFVGQWTATAVTPAGNMSETLTVVKTAGGYEIKAELVGPVPEGAPQAGPGSDIVMDGDKFSYKRTVITPDGPLVITYTGTVSGDKFTGTVNLGGFAEAPYNGVRLKVRDQGERLEHGQ
jgi:hypothetical protein